MHPTIYFGAQESPRPAPAATHHKKSSPPPLSSIPENKEIWDKTAESRAGMQENRRKGGWYAGFAKMANSATSLRVLLTTPLRRLSHDEWLDVRDHSRSTILGQHFLVKISAQH